MGWSKQCFISDRKEGWGEGRKEGKGEEKEKRKGKEGRKERKNEREEGKEKERKGKNPHLAKLAQTECRARPQLSFHP